MTSKWKNHLISSEMILLLYSIAILWLSCENPITSPGPQPNFIEKIEEPPMLNILGVLRPDLQDGISKSFIHVETTSPVTDEYPDSLNINNAEVIVYTYGNNMATDSVQFNFTNYGTFLVPEYRSKKFQPVPLKKYGLKCQHSGHITLSATTIVPAIPIILNDSVIQKNGELRFTIQRDSLAALYEIYLWVGHESFQTKVIRPETSNVAVTLRTDKSLAGKGILMIYAYDENLGNYLTSNLTIKPNTYLPSFSTVENGYGCFGSLNILMKELVF